MKLTVILTVVCLCISGTVAVLGIVAAPYRPKIIFIGSNKSRNIKTTARYDNDLCSVLPTASECIYNFI